MSNSQHSKANRIAIERTRPTPDKLREGQRKLFVYDGMVREYIKVDGRLYYKRFEPE